MVAWLTNEHNARTTMQIATAHWEQSQTTPETFTTLKKHGHTWTRIIKVFEVNVMYMFMFCESSSCDVSFVLCLCLCCVVTVCVRRVNLQVRVVRSSSHVLLKAMCLLYFLDPLHVFSVTMLLFHFESVWPIQASIVTIKSDSSFKRQMVQCLRYWRNFSVCGSAHSYVYICVVSQTSQRGI